MRKARQPLSTTKADIGRRWTGALRRYFFLPLGAFTTLVVIEAVLLAGFGSGVSELTVAVLVILVLPRTITVTWICAACWPLLASSPRYQVTTPVWPDGGVVKAPTLACALTKVVPLDKVSFATTLIALSGPKLCTVIV